MASPEEVVPSLPDTLPEDFSEWDGQASPAVLPVNSREWEAWAASHSLAKPPKSVSHPAERKTMASQVVDRPRDKRPAPTAPVPAKPQKDFDREPTPVPLRVNSNEWEAWAASFGKPAKPLAHSGDREATSSPAVAKPRDTRRVPSAPLASKQQAPASELADASSSHASVGLEASHPTSEAAVAVIEPDEAVVEEAQSSPEAAPTLSPAAEGALFQGFSSKNIEAVKEPATSGKKKKQIIVAAASACVILPLLVIPFLHHGAKAAAKQSVETLSTATVTETQTDTPNQPASAPSSTPDKSSAASATQQAPNSEPANGEKGTNSAPAPTKAQAQLMDDQLTAPTRIPQGANKQVAENAPPPANFGAAGADGLGANDSIFNGHAQPVVKAALSKPLAISSGVATGMLIQKTPPIYPAIAKSARVAGTVQLHAVIAKNGTIKDLQLVSGPEMLRQAAIDAVRTWRYRPYKLDNQPTEVETTVNVVFTLGQ